MTTKSKPPMERSDEANLNQLELARSQGKAYVKALRHMVELVADGGEEQRAGDYIVAYAIEGPEGMYHLEGDGLVWREPGDSNLHIEISVRDGSDDRFVYGATVYVTVIDQDGKNVGRHEQPLLWHPWLPHYGRNWKLPGSGRYDLKVEIEPPKTPRHDEKNGKRYAERVELTFEGVSIKVH
ncbi:MAG: iron transporter [Anaerolineales bacterium]